MPIVLEKRAQACEFKIISGLMSFQICPTLVNHDDLTIISIIFRRMLQTTCKKTKSKYESDPHVDIAISELQAQVNSNTSAEHDFFSNNLNALRKALALLQAKRIKSPDWKDVYYCNLRNCITLRKHRTIVFHFEVVKLFWKASFFNVDELLSCIKKIHQRYEEHMARHSWPEYSQSEVLIDYYIKLKNQNDKKVHLIEKIIGQQCQYFCSLAETTQQFFNHYLAYSSKMDLINIFLYASEAYLRYVVYLKKENFESRYSHFRIFYEILEYYKSKDTIEKGNLNFIANIVLFHCQLLKRPKYLYSLKNFLHNDIDVFQYTGRMLQLLQKFDKEDSLKAARTFIYAAMLSKCENSIIRLENPLQVSLDEQSSIVNSFLYIASLHHYIMSLNSSVSKKKLESMHESAIKNIKMIIQLGHSNQFQSALEYVYYDLTKTKSDLYLDSNTSSLINKIEALQPEEYKNLTKWLPIFNFLIEYYEIFRFQKLENPYKMHLSIKFYILLANYIDNHSLANKNALVKYVSQFTSKFQKDKVYHREYCMRIFVLIKLCFSSDVQEVAVRCLKDLLKGLPIGIYAYIRCYQFENVFAYAIRTAQESQEKIGHNIRHNFYVADAVRILTIDLIKSFQHFQKSGTVHNWMSYLQHSLNALFFFIEEIDEESQQYIERQLLKITEKQQYFDQIVRVLKLIAFDIISQGNLCKISRQKQLQNLLTLYQMIYDSEKPLRVSSAISFIDFCFNLKNDLFSLLDIIDPSLAPLKKFILETIDRMEQLQAIILESTAKQYIERLSEDVTKYRISDFAICSSIIIKSVYYTFYEQKYNNKLVLQQPDEKQAKVAFNIEQQLEGTVSKLLEVKKKCQRILPYFRQQFRRFTVKFTLGPIIIKNVDIKWDRHSLAQLNDLMYMAYLCGTEELKTILLNFRLSIIHSSMNQIFLLQITKYLFLKIFQVEDEKNLTDLVKKMINQEKSQTEELVLTRLLLFGQLNSGQTFSGRIFKIFYLLNQHGMTYFNNFKEIVNYLSQFFFMFSNVEAVKKKERFGVKTTRNAEKSFLNEYQYWIKNCWEEGWVLTKLMIIASQKILQTAINTNQISKIQSFLKFLMTLCVKTAHISQLKTSLILSMQTKVTINLMSVIDSIQKLQAENLCNKAYKEIDKMIFMKRISISRPYDENIRQSEKILRLYLKIDESFKNCKKCGPLLAEIFCVLAAKQSELNAYEAFMYRSKLPLLGRLLSEDDKQLMALLNTKHTSQRAELFFISNLTEQLVPLVFSNYSKAILFRDRISSFLDNALDQQNISSFSKAQHELIDRIIAKIALAFEGFNYSMKTMLQKLPKLSIKEKNSQEIINVSDSILREYKRSKDTFAQQITSELESLKFSSYPVSVICPIGNYLFTISFYFKLLVTFNKRYLIEDRIQQCSKLIQNNEKLLQTHVISKANQNKRIGFDRELGKICKEIDLGILDIDYHFVPKKLLEDFQRIDHNIIKFACNQSKAADYHFEVYSKRFKIDADSLYQMAKENLKNRGSQNENLLILIHEKYLQFPFEIIKSVRQKRGIYRLPSIKYLLENQDRPIYYNMQKCKYLVNTLKNLPETEVRFQKIKNYYKNWMGIKGKVPQIGEIQILLNNELFLYMGHGTGLEHLKDDVALLQPNCPMLVFGCNSAKMVFGNTEPYGCAYTLLMKGCPAYMGCMWMVTDLDVDMITEEIFVHSSCENLSLILEAARKKCVYQFINGSSTVVYGLPVYLQK